jgi:hypothetical protein
MMNYGTTLEADLLPICQQLLSRYYHPSPCSRQLLQLTCPPFTTHTCAAATRRPPDPGTQAPQAPWQLTDSSAALLR